jgi:micrococcal nuclease
VKIPRVLVSRVISCFDGDTFRVDVDTWPKLFGYHIPVRVRGIDCPERRSTNPEEYKKAIQAWEFTKVELINGKRIVLCNVSRGKYFRLIADVKIDDRDLGTALLLNGLAVQRK